jgi:cobalamin biosynthesis protein CobW
MTRIPVLVVSGYLGSGKTTLVRHLLADAQRTGARVAVISNEFGELGIDAALLGSQSDDYVELSGGCVCCKLSDALVETLETLRERAQPDRIVIETSGVALPFETQLQLWRDPVRQWIADDVASVVVNAEQLAAGRDLDDTFTQQVSSADFLLLNQIDRVPAAELPRLERELRKWEPDAPLLRPCTRGVARAAVPARPRAGARAAARGGRRGAPRHMHAHFAAEEIVLPPASRAPTWSRSCADSARCARRASSRRARGCAWCRASARGSSSPDARSRRRPSWSAAWS